MLPSSRRHLRKSALVALVLKRAGDSATQIARTMTGG